MSLKLSGLRHVNLDVYNNNNYNNYNYNSYLVIGSMCAVQFLIHDTFLPVIMTNCVCCRC